MTRNIYHFRKETRYNERLGRPYIVWFAFCTFPSGKFFYASALTRMGAWSELKRVLREVQHSANLGVKYLEKKENES